LHVGILKAVVLLQISSIQVPLGQCIGFPSGEYPLNKLHDSLLFAQYLLSLFYIPLA